MKLPPHIAAQLLQLLQGEKVSAAVLKHAVVADMLEDGIVQQQRVGKTRSVYYIANAAQAQLYISNKLGIPSLHAYLAHHSSEAPTRAAAVVVSGTSKLTDLRTFKGFLVNCYTPIAATLNGAAYNIAPPAGTFHFVYDYEGFIPPATATIVGVENAENFRWIEKQQYLFSSIQPLFLSRYPQSQSGDVIKWLQRIPNLYLHFGDFDFEGINIYLREYARHLPGRTSFFIPPNIETLLQHHGNRDLYNAQLHHAPDVSSNAALAALVALFHKYKMVLEQEGVIGAT